jgi:RNA-binding protein
MLNGKQKRYLRSLASRDRAIFQIGKDGLSDAMIEQIGNALKSRELVKISVLKNSSADLKETAFDLAMHTKSEVVQIIGHTIVLYRKAEEPQILLP